MRAVPDAEDRDAVAGAESPVLTFGFHARLLRERVEVMRAFGGVLGVLEALGGEGQDLMNRVKASAFR